MSVHPNPKNFAAETIRRLSKRQPSIRRPKNPGETKTRKLVADRSGGWCEICGIERAESVHHRRKRSQGGPWSASNCVATCGDGVRGCHGWAEANPDAAKINGFHLRPGESSTETKVISGLHGVVWLSDDGSISEVPS